MAGEFAGLHSVTPSRIAEAISKRDGRSGNRRQFQSLLKREQSEEDHPPPKTATPLAPPDTDPSTPDTPPPANLGKVMDYQA